MKFAPAVISLALTVAVDLCAETVQCLPEHVKPTDVASTRLVQTDGGTLVEKIRMRTCPEGFWPEARRSHD